MIEPNVNRYNPSEVSPPGETLRELLDDRSINQAELAARMGRPQKTISEIINGKAAITPETALELELVLGIPADFWIAREKDFRTYIARAEQIECFRKDIRWAKKFPFRRMIELGWMPADEEESSLVRNLLEFFGVASSRMWERQYANYEAMFRKTPAFKADCYSLSAWLRAGIAEAEKARIKSFTKHQFMATLDEARKLIVEPPEVFCLKLAELFAETGVAVTFIPELPKSRASGATMWLSPDRALIQLSLRYKTEDHLWFTFFHESAHILLHNKRAIFLEGEKRSDEYETKANEWAANFLIPLDEYKRFVSKGTYVRSNIIAFARALGITPGIVVGRLQHDNKIEYARYNDLKQKLTWATKN